MTEHAPPSPHGAWDFSLWTGLLLAPIAWLCQLQAAYSLVPWVCATRRHWVLHVITVVFLLVTAFGGWVSWRHWRQIGRGSPTATEGGMSGTARFMAVLGMLVSAMFFLLILAQGIPSFIISPCED